MSSLQPPQAECKWCGETFPAGTEKCPQCGRPVPPLVPSGAYPNPPGGPPFPAEPVEPAMGRGSPGFLENAWQIIRAEKALMAVFALQALNVVLAVVSGDHFRIILSGLTLFGLATFQRWGYWLTMIGASLGLVLMLFAALAAFGIMAIGFGGSEGMQIASRAAVFAIATAAIYVFVLVVLYTRRDRFG
jgi:hypothetical protein